MTETTTKSLLRKYTRLPETPDETVDRYEANVKLLRGMITEGENSKDRVWRNTCKWLTDRKILHVLSATHEVNQVTGKRKYLGIDRPVPLGPQPTATQETEKNYGGTIMLLQKSLKGLDLSAVGKLLIVDPILETREKVKWILMHEVQHAVTHRSLDWKLPEESYALEFVADWVAGVHAKESDRPGTATEKEPYEVSGRQKKIMVSGFHNARQLAIFARLYEGYEIVQEMWDYQEFRNVVLNLKGPQGPNLINSLRIDNLYAALIRENGPDMDAAHRAMHALKKNPEDIAAIRSQEPAWRKVFEKHPEETRIFAAELFPELSLKNTNRQSSTEKLASH